MPLALNDLTVSFSHLDRDAVLDGWQWLTGDKRPILITAMGNAFVQDPASGGVWLLDVGQGSLEQVAASAAELREHLRDREFVYSRFLVEAFMRLSKEGRVLNEGQVYGFVLPPVLGGSFEADNLEPMDMQVHFWVSGQIHRQVKDLPPDTPIMDVCVN